MAESTEDTAKLIEQYRNLTSELEMQVKVLSDTLREKDSHMQQTKEALLQEIKEKENRITDLEFELLSVNSELNKSNVSVGVEKADEGSEKYSVFWSKQIEEKNKEVERLETELRKRTCDLQGVVNKELWEKNREIEKLQRRFGAVTENKDHIISELKTQFLNKESQLKLLRDKISELGLDIDIPEITEGNSVSDETKTLQEQLKVCQQERKFFVEQIEKLQCKLKANSSNEQFEQLEQLKSQHKCLIEELEKSEQLRSESNEICRVLSTRLEELAQFLGSLLQQKGVLGFLGWKRNNKLKQIVSQSLNLSRALTTSILQHPDQSLMQLSHISDLLNTTKTENVSLSEFFDRDDDSGSVFSIIPSDISLTYHSHLQQVNLEQKPIASFEEQAKVITVLRKQVENLKHEVELRDTEISKLACGERLEVETDQDLVDVLIDMSSTQAKVMSPKKIVQQLMGQDKPSRSSLNTSSTLKNRTDNHSESESWSEPDRTVSMARIGLDDECLKPQNSSASHRRSKFLTSVSTESTEDELSHTLNRTPSKRSLLAENRQTIISLHEEVLELEKKLKEKDGELVAAQMGCFEASAMLKEEQMLRDKHEKELGELQTKLTDIESKWKETSDRKTEAEKEVEMLHANVHELEEALHLMEQRVKEEGKSMKDKINEMELQKQHLLDTANKSEAVAKKAEADLQETQLQVKNLHEDLKQCELKYESRISSIHKEYEMKIQKIQQSAELEVSNAHSAIQQMQMVIEKEYVRRSEVDKKVLEVELIVEELEHLKCMLHNAEQKMQNMEQQEIQLKQKLLEMENHYRDKIDILHKELDSATLQYSETVLEKTKLANEKIELEQKIKNFSSKEAELLEQVGEFQREVSEMKTLFQTQMVTIERQKCKLEMRVSELESLNAELRHKLVRLQTGLSGDHHSSLSLSLPSSPNRAYELYDGSRIIPGGNASLYRRQCSDHSGYTSEEQQPQESRASRSALLAVNDQVHNLVVDTERNQANSSPDLGIESDQGRFSSLEAHIPRPYLRTLELTESMSNLLDGERRQMQDTICNNEQCCQKTREVISENYDLKRRLMRTRRALEETVTQLNEANQRKKQVERTICKQIHKTSQVLRKAKANLDSGSETDVCKK